MKFKDCSLWHHLIFCEELVIDAKEMDSEAKEMESNAKEMDGELEEMESNAEKMDNGAKEMESNAEEMKGEPEVMESNAEEMDGEPEVVEGNAEEMDGEAEVMEDNAEEMDGEAEVTEGNAEEMESNADEVESDIEELESGVENNSVCRLCEKPVSECPAYKCLECNFLIHASCAQTKDHDFEDRHHLMYVEEGENSNKEGDVCMGCEEPASGPSYKCCFGDCPFLIHKSCTPLSHVIHHHAEQPDHISTLQLGSVIGCVFCGDRDRELESLFYRCPICNFTIHMKCFSRLQISADDHQHRPLIPLPNPIPFTCQACGCNESKVRAHVCTGCGLLIHRECGKFPHTIDVYIHGHFLIRTYFIFQLKKEDPIFCNLCYRKVNIKSGAYYCQQCNYIVHMRCAKNSEYWRAEESATINFNEYKAYMVHLVEGLNAREGETTSPSKMNHFSHPQHEIILSYEEPQDEKRCEACMLLIIFAPFYSCKDCHFFLHRKCAKLPPTITRGPLHQHPFTAITIAPSTEVFKCYYCNCRHHGFAYACNKCPWQKWDVQCLFIPETLNHESHLHPLFFALGSDDRCNGCAESGVNFRCIACEFNLCFKCINLPLVTRHPCDPHILKLTYSSEDYSKEYYCFICEEKRDPDVWFYYCKECDFATHIYCAIGENPHIKFGSTLHKKNHQHLLKFVQTNKGLAKCDFCKVEFWHGVALEYTQCNIQVHYDCSDTLLC